VDGARSATLTNRPDPSADRDAAEQEGQVQAMVQTLEGRADGVFDRPVLAGSGLLEPGGRSGSARSARLLDLSLSH